MRYAKIALGLPINQLFDYSIPETLACECSIGARVAVPFSKRKLVGYVAGLTPKTNITGVRPITKLIDPKPIVDKNLLRLTKIVSDYYCSSWGQTIESALPTGIRKGISVNVNREVDKEKVIKNGIGDFQAYFIQGDSLEERFQIYSGELTKALEQKKSIIIVSPEIKLSLRIFYLLKQKHSHRIAVTYRKQKIKEELRIWLDAKNGNIDILIGTRPAVFAPIQNLGLIIIEEEDAYGYKEEQAPYYHAREVALIRAKLEGCKVILAGKTPTLETYYAIKTKKYQLITAGVNAEKNLKIKIVDMKQYSFSKQGARPVISAVLDDRIHKVLAADKIIIIFINRKGFASSAYCPKCGILLVCDKCNRTLTFYADEKKLICNLCGSTKAMPSVCPQCKAQYIKYKGFGIERIKSQLHLAYPQAKICHIDKEHQVLSADFQILIATEMLFHRERIPQADVVAAIDLDGALQIINFRAHEKLYALVYRLKTIARDELLIQTRMPEHYQRKEFIHFNLHELFDIELKERKALQLPPFMHLAAINLRGKDLERTRKIAFEVYEKCKDKDSQITIFEPTESIPSKSRGSYRFAILLKAKNPFTFSKFLRKHLRAVNRFSGITITTEIDPQ